MNFNEYKDQLALQEDIGVIETNIDPREDNLFIVEDIDDNGSHAFAVIYRKFGLWRAPKTVGNWAPGDLFIGGLPYVMDNIFRISGGGYYKTRSNLLEDYPKNSLLEDPPPFG
jgi:hypothetical protein